MAQSAIRYAGRVLYIADGDLREFLKFISVQLSNLLSGRSELNWLAAVAQGWMEDHENLPPGLRDIELDKALDGAEKAASFTKFIAGLLEEHQEQGPYDLERAAAVANRIAGELKPAVFSR